MDKVWQAEISKVRGQEFVQVLWTAGQRFRKALSGPYSSLFQLTQAHSNQGLPKWSSPEFVDTFRA
jgi:hypothetical protein